MSDWLVADSRLQNAARVAATFGMDPVAVLAAPRQLYELRLAAAIVVHRDGVTPTT